MRLLLVYLGDLRGLGDDLGDLGVELGDDLSLVMILVMILGKN